MKLWLGILATLVLASTLAEAAVAAKGSATLRLRYEQFDTPSGNAALDQQFGGFHARLRLKGAASHGSWSIQGVLQGATTLSLPENGAFGINPVYLVANDGDTDPGKLSLLEGYVSGHGRSWDLKLGRQPFAEGAELKTGVKYLDGVAKARLAERLIGNWDWVNVGRRYDGVRLGAKAEDSRIEAFYIQPLAGGVNYKEAHEWLDDLQLYGVTMSSVREGLFPTTLVRGSVFRYEDERPGAINATGSDVDVWTVVGSILGGSKGSDALVWVAGQFGDWGNDDHSAWAVVVEVGKRLSDVKGKPQVRVGYAQASGDDGTEGDHTSFFNVLPTNHKFYGRMDYNAFSNLRNLYAIASFAPAKSTSVRLAAHTYLLVERTDAWYGGSGAFNENVLGYAARRPASGTFRNRGIGQEVDVDITHTINGNLKTMLGGGFFRADQAADEVLTHDGDGYWGYLQVVANIQ